MMEKMIYSNCFVLHVGSKWNIAAQHFWIRLSLPRQENVQREQLVKLFITVFYRQNINLKLCSFPYLIIILCNSLFDLKMIGDDCTIKKNDKNEHTKLFGDLIFLLICLVLHLHDSIVNMNFFLNSMQFFKIELNYSILSLLQITAKLFTETRMKITEPRWHRQWTDEQLNNW